MLFFALTGALQVFNLHEAHGGYRPPVLLEKLSGVHRDQVFARPHEHDEPLPSAQPGAAPDEHGDDDDNVSPSTLALKWLFFLVSAGLILSTSIGVWMGVTQIRKTSLALALIAAGTLLPMLLLAF